MIPIFSSDDADELWRAAWTAVRDNAAKTTNPLYGGSTEIHHVILELRNPRQRWTLARTPAINPAFAIAEVVWIMRGRQDAAFLTHWNRALTKFVGHGDELHGAYGWRLRHSTGIDQLVRAYEALGAKPYSRQVVLQIWSARDDIPNSDGSPVDRDIPCSIVSLVKVVDGKLDWLQVIRSNDICLGLPYNLIQWTTVQEIVAGWLNLDVGTYTQVRDSLHLYSRDPPRYQLSHLRAPRNTDDIRLDYDSSTRVFAHLESIIDNIITKGPLDCAGMQRLDGLPVPYRNWLALLLAESWRRLENHSAVRQSIENCTNPTLRRAWEAWSQRFD